MKISRADTGGLAAWWFTVDHVKLVAIFALMLAGLVLSFAASPASAEKLGLPAFYFAQRHMVFSALGVAALLSISFLSPSNVRRLALLIFLPMLLLMIGLVIFGDEIKGARRWVYIFGFSLQPSEFAKPAFVVLSAWLFSEANRRPDMPALPIAIGSAALFVVLLALQPDVGQAMLVAGTWCLLYILAGSSLVMAVGIVGAVLGGGVIAYFSLEHVRARIDQFFDGSIADHSQLGRAARSFAEGGFFGRGPGEGTIKVHFPDAHNDFIFSVIAEEYGVLACLVLVGLFGFVVLRAMIQAVEEPDSANGLGIQGLAILFGCQALINMGVNAGLLPAKGMTLPLISSGGSSMLAICVTLGMLLALTRRRVYPTHVRRPSLVSGAGHVSFRRSGQR